LIQSPFSAADHPCMDCALGAMRGMDEATGSLFSYVDPEEHA
jgi:hypothetical protein